MARRPSLLTAAKKKQVRKTRSEVYLVNLKFMGDEPAPVRIRTNNEYGVALNWYSTMCDVGDARDYLNEYLECENRVSEIKRLARVSDTWVPLTAAWIARMALRGVEAPALSLDFLEVRLAEALKKEEIPKPAEPAQIINFRDKTRDRAGAIIGDIENMLDRDMPFSLYNYLQKNQVPRQYMELIIDFYAPQLGELFEAQEGKDSQLVEGYSKYPRGWLKRRIDIMDKLISDAERYGEVKKVPPAPKKPRIHKPISLDKLLQFMTYQKNSNEYKIASIDPKQIPGSQELWTFNTRYRIITVFRAKTQKGLGVHRSSVIDYDSATSMTKRTGRDAEKLIKETINCSRMDLKKIMDQCGSTCGLAQRINENTVILRVVR